MSNITNQNINKNCNYSYGNLFEKLCKTKDFIKNEFIHGGHLISLGTAGIAFSFMFLYNTIISWEFLIIIYLGTLCIYNYDYYRGFKEDCSHNIGRTDYLKKSYKYRALIDVLYGIGFFSLLIYYGNIASIIFGGFLLLSAILYSYRIKKFTTKVVGFKSYYTALSFSLSIIFAALYCSYPIDFTIFAFFGFVFLQILLITSFCDLKDLDADKKHHLITLPIFFGKNKFLQFLHIINFISLFLIISAIIFNLLPLYSMFLFFSYLYCFYFIQKAKNPSSNLYNITNVIVDASYFFWPFFLILGKSVIILL